MIKKRFTNHEGWKKIQQPRRLETNIINPKGWKQISSTLKARKKFSNHKGWKKGTNKTRLLKDAKLVGFWKKCQTRWFLKGTRKVWDLKMPIKYQALVPMICTHNFMIC